MIIHNFNFPGIGTVPAKTDPPLSVYADAVLPFRASNLLPGGMRRSSIILATCSSNNLRRAGRLIFENRRTDLSSKRPSVSLSAKLRIMAPIWCAIGVALSATICRRRPPSQNRNQRIQRLAGLLGHRYVAAVGGR